MAVTINITVEDIADQLDTYTSIQLESATSPGGSYSLVTTITLVDGTYYYNYTDAAGTLSTWYRYRYHNPTGPVDSDYTNPFQVQGVSRLRIRQRMLNKYRAGLVALMDGAGTTTSITTADARLKTGAYSAGRATGAWANVTSGARAGEAHLVTGSTPSGGDLTVDAFSGAFVSGDEFELIWLADPYIINDAINAGLLRYWYLERVPIVGVANQVSYDLTYLPWLRTKKQVTGLWWYPDTVEEPFTGYGRWWDLRQDRDRVTLMIGTAIDTTDTLYLDAYRQMDPLYTDASLLPSVADLDLCAALAYDETLRTLLQPGQAGTTEDRTAWQQARDAHQGELLRLLKLNAPKPRYGPTRTLTPSHVQRPWRTR